MKRKHFILALVAMLWSFSFSAFADDVIVVRSWAELKAALEANDGVQRSAARQRSTAMRATGTQIPGTPYFYEDFAGKRVLLEADVVEESPVTIALEGSATIDLNGHTMKGSTDGSHSYPIVNNGNLLVVDNSVNGNGAIYCGIKTGVKFTTGDINHDAVFVMTRGNIICAHENDDDAALVNYGIAYITGGTIEGAKNAVWNEPGSKFYAKVPALIEGEVKDKDNVGDGVLVVAKIGTVKYTSLNAAFAAAKEGETIKMLADATPTLKSQSAITKAAVIDLNGKTLTLDKGDLYFGTTTFQNGNVVVKPGVNASTAVFWMFANQTLTFDNVDIVATGVTGTYLIGINGGTGTAVNILNGSSITMANDAVAKLTAVICDNGTNNNVTIDNSTITVNNIDGRFYLGGTKGDIVVNNSAVTLNGVKEGFYLRADQTLDITGNSTVDIALNSNEGRYGINCTEFTSIYNKESSATVNATVYEPKAAAMIGNKKFRTLQEAINAAVDGDVVVLKENITEDVLITQKADLDLTIDGDGKTFTGVMSIDGAGRSDGDETLTIKNINFVAKAGADACINCVDKMNPGHCYSHNVTVNNCTFTDPDGTVNCAAVRQDSRIGAGDVNWTISKCTVDATMHSLVQVSAIKNLVIEGNTVNSKNGINLNNTPEATLRGNKINVLGYALRVGDSSSAGSANKYVLENNTLKSAATDDAVIVFRNSATAANLSMKENAVIGTTHISGLTKDTKLSIDENYWNGDSQPTVNGADVKVNSYYSDEALQNLRYNHYGNGIIGYTRKDAIWGESWGNAFKSYVVKVLDANDNVMGTTSLNNVGGIIDGDVTATWSLLLDAASNKDKYWTMEWTTAPTLDNMPAKVQLYVDGTKVSEGPVQLNGPDGLNKMNVAITDADGKILSYHTTLNAALAAIEEGQIIALLNDVTMDYNARDAYETQAQNVVINGNGKVLTLNQKNSDWASFGLANNSKLVLKNMTIEKTGYGDTSGAWNTHAIIFSCPVEMTDVTINNGIAVQAGAILNNVTINEANGYYGLWINGNGQTVTVNGGAINATNGGRGIKIADQYIDAPAQVTLNVTDTKFSTAKKAAVLVSSKAGALIAASNVNIENVTEDKVNFVWVDEDWAANYGGVTANEGTKVAQEGIEKFHAAIVNGTAVKGYYKTFADALAAAQAGDAITLLADIEATEVILLGKSLTINGNGHKVTSNATRVFRVTTSDTKVTLNDVNMVSRTVMVYPNDIRGISIDAGLQNVELTLNNCSVDFTDATACDWAYAVNVSGNGTGHTVTVNGGTYEGANVINVHGANNTVTVKDATLTSLYPANDQYYGAAIWVLQKQNSSVEATGNTFEGSNAIAFNLGTGTVLTESDNTDNTSYVVAKADGKYYYSFAEAVDKAEKEVMLLHSQVGTGVVIDKDLTIDFNGKTYTVNKTVGSAGTTTLGFQILKDNNVTLKNGTLTSTAVTEGKEVKMLVQNYANLTVDNMKLVDATDHILYVLSNNSGTVNVVNGSEITTDAIALDACKYASYEAPTVTVAEGVKVTGDVEVSATLNFAGTLNGDIVINGVDGKVTTTTVEGKNVTTTVAHYNVIYADGAYALVHKIYVAEIGENQYEKFAEALAAVQDGETIELIDVEGSEVKTEIEFTKDIKFTITGKAPKYALPVITFQNAEVTINDAEILIPELDARQNAVINVVNNSTVHDAGGDGIVKSYYNGAINIDATSTVYTMQVTTMGYINVAGTLNATWQTNVYGNGMISLAKGATFNTAALHLTGKDYSGRDNTAADRVGKPATIVVNGATLNVGKVYSDNGADYSYNSSKGINVGTIDGKAALLDIKNGGAVNFYMANGQTTNFGAGATVNVDASTLKTISRDENGTVTLANNGVVNVTGASNLNIKNFTGNAINATNTTLADVQFGGAVNAFGTNNISGTSVIGGVLSLGYGTNPTEQVVVNITGNFNGNNVLVYTNNGVDNILNVGKADGERTTVHFGQLGAFADVNVVNADVTYGYAFIRNDFNATNSTFEIKGGVNTYFAGNAKVVLDNTTWNLSGYANIGSYGGYMYGNADVTLKNGSSMTATNLGVEVNGEKVVKLTIDNTSSFAATNLTNQGVIDIAGAVSVSKKLTNTGTINFTDLEATLAAQEGLTINHDFGDSYKVERINGVYGIYHYVASVDDVNYESLKAALQALTDGATLTLLEDITEEAWACHTITANNVTINGNDHALTFTGEVNDGYNYNGIFRFENNMAVKNLTIDASNATGIERGITAKLGITVDSCEFIGNGNGYAVIFGEGAAEADLANVEVSITNSTFTNWSKGVSDNANGEDAKNVSIANNIFTNASVNVSASEYVNFTKNTVEGGDVIITSYSNAVDVKVQATTNELEEGRTYQIISNPTNIVPQAEFSVPVARIDKKYYLTLQEAVNVDNSTIILVDNIRLAEAVVVEGKTATLDLNNKWIRPVDNSVTMTGGLIRLHEGANLTINDNGKDKKGEIYTNGNHNVYAAVSVLGDNASLTVNSGKLTGYYYGIAGNGNYEGTTVTIKGGEIASIEGTGSGIYHPQNGTLTVNGGTITGATGIYFKSGSLVIDGDDVTIHGTGAKVAYGYNGSGANATGDALVIENVAEGGYEAIGTVSIKRGTFISDNADPIASYGDDKLDEFLGDGCNALFNKEFDESLLVVGYQLKDDDNDGFYGVKWTNYRQSMVFVDGEFTEYTHTQDMTVGKLTYIRASIPTTWTPIYLPFEVPVSLLADKFEVAYINGVRRGDVNFDGQLDDFVMEIIYIHGGNANGSAKTLKANYPYFIRSKNGVREDLNITVSDATLYAAAKAKPYDCTSMTEKYTLIGNLSQVIIKGSDDKTLRYTVSSGNWSKRTKDSELKPFRFSMEITSRDEEYNPIVSSAPVTMSIAVRGEEREDGTTLIYDIEEDQTVDYIYDLHGRRVMEPQKGGIYIINGKKVVF